MHDNAEVVDHRPAAIPDDCDVIIATSHKLGAIGERKRLLDHFGAGANGEAPFDVLFVDEAWQLPHHLFDKVTQRSRRSGSASATSASCRRSRSAPNPWRGDPGYNPYRAWPTDYDDDARTWSRELPGRLASDRRAAARCGARSTPSGTSSTASPRPATASMALGAGLGGVAGGRVAAGRDRRPDAARGRRARRTPRPPTSTCR